MSKLAKDLTVALREDRPGQIAKAAEALAKARINAEGLAEIEGLLHILTKKTGPAKKALSAVGFEVREQTVVVVSIENRPGRAAGIFRRIADANHWDDLTAIVDQAFIEAADTVPNPPAHDANDGSRAGTEDQGAGELGDGRDEAWRGGEDDQEEEEGEEYDAGPWRNAAAADLAAAIDRGLILQANLPSPRRGEVRSEITTRRTGTREANPLPVESAE